MHWQFALRISVFMTFLSTTSATTEWFGDLRAHLNPPRAPAFYDVVYDNVDCPAGMQSNAIPDYVYFGEMLATKSVNNHTECLRECLQIPECKSVNFFEPISVHKKVRRLSRIKYCYVR